MRYWAQNILLIAAILFNMLRCSQTHLDDNTVAIANKEIISKDDLVYNIEFFPQYAPNKHGEDKLRAHLDLLIEKKLFAQQGHRLGFDRTDHVRKVTEWIKRDAMVKELYHREVKGKVTVTEQEIKEAYLKGIEQFRVRHIFVKTEEEAKQVKSALKAGIPFKDIAAETFQDSMLAANGGDLGFLSYSDMDADFAEAVYSLQIGQISEPIRTKWGFHIIRVDDHRRQIFATQDDVENQRIKLESEIRRKKEKALAGAFVKQYLEARHVQLVNDGFNRLTSVIRKIVIDGTSKLPNYQPALGETELELVARTLEYSDDIVLVTFDGGQWTIGDFVEKLRALPSPKRPRLDTPQTLRHDIGVMLRDEFLAKEAERRGMNKVEPVRKEVAHWQDEFTFGELWQAITDTLSVSDSEIASYHTVHSGRYWMPERVHVREILVKTKTDAEKILRKLEAGEDFSKLAQKHSLRTWAAERGGDLGLLSRGQYGNISTTAFKSDKGQLSGPIQVREGFSVIQLLARERRRRMTSEEGRSIVTSDILREKRRQVYAQWVTELRQKAMIQVNDTLLLKMSQDMVGRQLIQMPGVREVR